MDAFSVYSGGAPFFLFTQPRPAVFLLCAAMSFPMGKTCVRGFVSWPRVSTQASCGCGCRQIREALAAHYTDGDAPELLHEYKHQRGSIFNDGWLHKVQRSSGLDVAPRSNCVPVCAAQDASGEHHMIRMYRASRSKRRQASDSCTIVCVLQGATASLESHARLTLQRWSCACSTVCLWIIQVRERVKKPKPRRRARVRFSARRRSMPAPTGVAVQTPGAAAATQHAEAPAAAEEAKTAATTAAATKAAAAAQAATTTKAAKTPKSAKATKAAKAAKAAKTAKAAKAAKATKATKAPARSAKAPARLPKRKARSAASAPKPIQHKKRSRATKRKPSPKQAPRRSIVGGTVQRPTPSGVGWQVRGAGAPSGGSDEDLPLLAPAAELFHSVDDVCTDAPAWPTANASVGRTIARGDVSFPATFALDTTPIEGPHIASPPTGDVDSSETLRARSPSTRSLFCPPDMDLGVVRLPGEPVVPRRFRRRSSTECVDGPFGHDIDGDDRAWMGDSTSPVCLVNWHADTPVCGADMHMEGSPAAIWTVI